MRVRRPNEGRWRCSPLVTVLSICCGCLLALAIQGPSIVGKLTLTGSKSDLKAKAEEQQSWQWSLQEDFDSLQEKVSALTAERDTLKKAGQELTAAKQAESDALKSARRELAAVKADRDTLRKELEAGGAGECTDRHSLLRPSDEKDKTNPDLAFFLRQVAIRDEVLVAVCNKNYAGPGGMLELWATSVRRAGVDNAMVVALDDETKANMDKLGFPAFRMDLKIPDSQKNSGSNHAVSALKFRILTNFLNLGYSVFLSDVDIITLQNPFNFLARDSDVESMSDGWDNATAYGYNDMKDDPSMGWARYAHSMRIFVFNSGLFYIRSTQAAIDLVNKVIYRVETEAGWDQALFNECIFFPNSPENKDPSVTRRVLDYMLFMNSKVLFKQVRHRPALQNHWPVMIHVNYHPDKFARMKAVAARYIHGDLKALDRFPDGSG